MNLEDLGKTVSKYAPLLGAVLPIPGGAAIGALVGKVADAFGGDIQNSDDLIKRIENDSDAQLKLATIESNEKIEIQKLLVDQIKLANEDRANARQRQVEISKTPPEYRDKTPERLAFLFVGGYLFLSLVIILILGFANVTKEELEPVIQVLKDSSIAVMLILSFYYGASFKKE